MAASEVTLKEFMELRFNGLDEKVDDQGKRIKALEDCISNDVKHVIRAWRNIARAVVGILVAVVIALAIAWVRQWVGL